MDEVQSPFVLHSRPAHTALGWCSRCPGRSLEEEVRAWRNHALTTAAPESSWLAPETGSDGNATQWTETCPFCERDELSVVTVSKTVPVAVTVTADAVTAEEQAEHPIGLWSLCRSCGASIYSALERASHG